MSGEAAARSTAEKSPRETVVVGLVAYAVVHLVRIVLSSNATGTVVLQALAAEIGAGRAGVAWSERALPPPSSRALVGAGVGLAGAALILGGGLATGALRGGASSNVSFASLLLGLVVSVAGAVRDEMLLRGIVVRAFRDHLPPVALLAIAGVVGVAASPELGAWHEVIARFGFATVMMAIWLRDRGAFAACGANAAFAFACGPLASGGLVDLRANGGAFASASGIPGSPAAAGALLACAIAVAFLTARPRLR